MTTGPAAPDSLDAALSAFLSGLDHASWFSALGEALTPSERADAEGYLAGLGLLALVGLAIAAWVATRTWS